MSDIFQKLSFDYDQRYPPLFFNPYNESQLKEFDNSMHGIMHDMVEDSLKFGMKDVNAILSNGLTVGEASLIMIRENVDGRFQKNKERKELCKEEKKILLSVRNALFQKMQIEEKTKISKFTKNT